MLNKIGKIEIVDFLQILVYFWEKYVIMGTKWIGIIKFNDNMYYI